MVSFNALTFLTLSISAVTAIPQYGHSHFHLRRNGNLAAVVNHRHSNELNDTECGPLFAAPDNEKRDATPCQSTHTEYVTSTQISTVTAELKRRQRTRTLTVTAGDGSTPTTSATADADAASSTAAVNSTSSDSSVSSGVKKGLSYNTNSLLNHFSGAAWAYNWAAGSGGSLPSGVEYVPMLWGRNGIAAWSQAAATAIAGGATHVLSFNEPDFPQQANIAAAEAATLHIANVAPLQAKGIKIGSPSITNSNIKGQGLDWMTAFLAACGGASNNCKIDFLAFHWYNNPGTFDNFKSHVQSVISLAKANGISKVWLTEFAVNGGLADQATFVKQAIPYLDSVPEVERYAYFMVGDGQMITGNALNVVGQAYNS